MWKYKCKSIFFSLLGAFAVGCLIAMFAGQNEVYQQLMKDTLPAAVLAQLQQTPILWYIAGGLGIAGLLNVFLIGSLLSTYLSGGMFLFMLFVIMIPDVAILIGILALPVMLAVSLYGWISLRTGIRASLKKASITGDDEIVRIYQIHHPLNTEYKKLGTEVRKTVQKINLAYALGLAALASVMFFVNNIFLVGILFVAMIFSFQYLSRIRQNAFASISALLVNDCDPEACASALIYYGEKRNGHYHLANRALFAQCLIYLNEPDLAQNVLISFPRSSQANLMAYWSLMGYCYYLLKDENGLNRAKTALENIRPNMGAMGMMVKSEELASLENKIRLMQGDFNTCKKYYLSLLQRSPTRLQKADSDYYIALISFVQEDYDLARMYFEKTVQIGNRLYFVHNAKNYLAKIEKTKDPSQTIYALSQGEDQPQE